MCRTAGTVPSGHSVRSIQSIPKEWIEFPSDVPQGQLRLMPEFQVPNRFPHGLRHRGANCRIEAPEQCLVSEILYQTWSEAKSEKVKFG
jgi:hypothetical protein